MPQPQAEKKRSTGTPLDLADPATAFVARIIQDELFYDPEELFLETNLRKDIGATRANIDSITRWLEPSFASGPNSLEKQPALERIADCIELVRNRVRDEAMNQLQTAVTALQVAAGAQVEEITPDGLFIDFLRMSVGACREFLECLEERMRLALPQFVMNAEISPECYSFDHYIDDLLRSLVIDE